MGIDVYWKDGRGEVLASVRDPGFLFELSNALYRQSDSVCLRFIDPIGDACFNQAQRPALLEELERFAAGIGRPGSLQHLQQVIELVRRADRLHTYVWSVGD